MKYNIPLEILNTDEGGCHLLLEAKFGNKQIGWMIIDTGANKTVFDQKLLEKYVEITGKIDEEISSGINASIVNSQKAIINNFQIADFSISKYETVLISLKHLNSIYHKISGKKIYGLIGGDFLLKYRCIIDYKSQVLIINS